MELYRKLLNWKTTYVARENTNKKLVEEIEKARGGKGKKIE